jgi:tetratricopeptide (TPR) repeat protein
MIATVLCCAITYSALAAARPAEASAATDKAEAYYRFLLGIQARLERDDSAALDELRRAEKLDPASGDLHAEIAEQLRDMGRIDEALAEAEAATRTDPQSAAAWRTLAQIRYYSSTVQGGEALEQAAAAYEAALKIESDDLESLATLADIYRRLGKNKEAAGAWERFLALSPGNAEGFMRMGQHYLAAGENEKAAAAFKRALDLQPSLSAYQNLGAIYAQAGDTDQAVIYFRKALEIKPDNLLVRLTLAETLINGRRNKEAAEEAAAALALDPKNRFALELKGRALRELKDFAGAEAVAKTLIDQDPQDPAALFLQITILEERHEWAAATQALRQALARPRQGDDAARAARQDHDFLLHLGVAETQLGHHAEAAKAFAQSRTLGEQPDADLLGYEVEARLRAKDLDGAAAALDAGHKDFPDNPSLVALQATVLRERGQDAEATALITKLRADGDKDPAVLLDVADFYRRAKRPADAEQVLRRARELAPRNVNVLLQLGATLERQKRADDAEVVFREALAVQPDSAPLLNYLGYMNADRGVRVEEALTLIDKALSLDPENAAFLDSQGWALFRLGRLEQAERSIRMAVAKMGANAVVRDHLGDVLRQRGQLREALTQWEAALAGEDEDEELNRPAVQSKIREAQATLLQPKTAQ